MCVMLMASLKNLVIYSDNWIMLVVWPGKVCMVCVEQFVVLNGGPQICGIQLVPWVQITVDENAIHTLRTLVIDLG